MPGAHLREPAQVRRVELKCDNMTGRDYCPGVVTMLDTGGYVYCTSCGLTRRQHEPCRKLRPHELKKLQRGEQLERY